MKLDLRRRILLTEITSMDVKPITLYGQQYNPDAAFGGRIKVAIVLMHFNYGGAERMVSLLASHLDLNRFEVRVFCIFGDPQNNAMEQSILNHGVPITYIRKRLGFSAKHAVRLGRELSSYSPMVVHTHLNACMYVAPWIASNRVTMIHTIHNIPDREASGLRVRVMKRLYSSGRAIPVAISERNRVLTAAFYGIPKSHVEMVVNPVDLSLFADADPKPWSERRYDYIHVARFTEQKNHAGLISAFAKLVSSREGFAALKLALVGEGSLEQSIRELVDRLDISDNVEFLGRRDDVAELMHDSKCFVLPSNYEGLPMTILEAMAAGLPVVATEVGGVSDIVKDGITGFLIDAGDEDSLVSAMSTVMSNRSIQQSMSSAAIEMVGAYDAEAVARRYGALYKRYSSEG